MRTINTIDTTDISFHGVRSNGQSGTLIHRKGTDTRISIWISLCHSGFKGPYISSVLRNSDFQ